MKHQCLRLWAAFVIYGMTTSAYSQSLFETIGRGNIDSVKIIVAGDASTIHTPNADGDLPLHIAAFNGHKDIVAFLLSQGADIEAVNPLNQTPLLYAAFNGHTDILNYLIEQGATFEYRDRLNLSPFLFAARNGHPDVVNALLDLGVDINEQGMNGNTALHFAVSQGRNEVVDCLVAKEADISLINDQGHTPLILALYRGRNKIVESLISDITLRKLKGSKAEQLLHIAASSGNADIVEKLLSHGTHDHTRDDHSNTLLHSAAAGSLTNLVHTLIEKGAEVNVTNDRGQTPLHKAVQTGSIKLTQMLIQNGSEVNVSDQTGRTPLHMALDWGDESMLRMLEQNGAVATPRKAIHIESGKMVDANPNVLEITYIANEGFLIQQGDQKICIDALVENPWGYMQTGDRVYEKMKKGESPFDEVDILIGSHNHLDHLTMPMVPDVLRGNPRMKLVSSLAGVDELKTIPNVNYHTMEHQVINITPELGEMVNKKIDGIDLQMYGINHAGPGQGAYLTLMTLMNFDDLNVLHVADIAPSSNLEYFKAFQLQDAGIDIAFIDPFMIADSVGQVIIRQYIQPKQIILMHMRPDEVDRYEKESQVIFNNVIAFREQMEKKCFQR